MSRWLDARIDEIDRSTSFPVTIVLDPHRLLPTERLAAVAETRTVDDWWSLRRAWELQGRDRDWNEGRLLIHVVGDSADARHLPFDISRRAATVPIDSPVPPAWGVLFASLLPETSADRVVDLARTRGDARALVEAIAGAAIPTGSASGELAAVALLRSRSALPDAIWDVVRGVVSTPLARSLAQQPPDGTELVRRWRAWLSGQREDQDLRDAGPALLGLVTSGMLPRISDMVPSAPTWAKFASADVDVAARAAELLEAPPVTDAPASIADWSAVATWMGTVRGLLSLDPASPRELLERAHACARQLDEAFEPWLRKSYGPLLQSTTSPPRTVNKIAPFLARRLGDNAPRVLLIVLDGVGFAQWHVIREATLVRPLQQHACMAILPSETAISRQALLSGETPDRFAASFHTTASEATRWSSFWVGEGLTAAEVRYHRVDGRRGDTIPFTANDRAVVVIVSAVDKLMHGSDLLGDVQLAAGVRAWCQQGFLTELLSQAQEHGFETWITADHGNVVARAGQAPPEGLRVERAGTRFRLYRSEATRDAAAALGVPWTPPRLPPDVHVLFAPDRTGFHRHGERVTHGGLSFEEVFVPLARMT